VFTSSAGFVFGELQRPVAGRERVVGLQSHNVACGRGDGTAGTYISRIRTAVFHKQRQRTRMKGREAQSQLGKTGAYGETDLAVVVLASACSPGSQPALRSARAIPRSRVACGAFNVEFTAIWVLFGRFWAVKTRNARRILENHLEHRRRRIKRDQEAATKHIEVSCQSSISRTFPSRAARET
jgi:hypothetical protein